MVPKSNQILVVRNQNDKDHKILRCLIVVNTLRSSKVKVVRDYRVDGIYRFTCIVKTPGLR